MRKNFKDEKISKELNSSLITVSIVDDPFRSKCVLGDGTISGGVCSDSMVTLLISDDEARMCPSKKRWKRLTHNGARE